MGHRVETTIYNKQKFLDNYPTFGYISKTCDAIAVSKDSIWMWLRRDKEFSSKFNVIKKDMEVELLARHEKNLHDIAFDTNIPPQTRVLSSIFMTKALDPNKYREKPNVIPLSGEITVKLAVPPYADEPSRHEKPPLLTEGVDNNRT